MNLFEFWILFIRCFYSFFQFLRPNIVTLFSHHFHPGGCKKLFRKVGDRSSEFYPHINEVRRDGSFIYEEFVETQGTDVKMYTVGPDYGKIELLTIAPGEKKERLYNLL